MPPITDTILLPGTVHDTASPPTVRTVRLALAGCGTVGSALLRLLRERAPAIARTHGVRFQVTSVLVRDAAKARPFPVPADVLTDSAADLGAADADIVVEVIGAVETAGRIAEQALGRGQHFVTANKALVAQRGAELAAAARASNVTFAFEAAVAGGVPVIRVLRDALVHTGITSIRGVLNGTTNYILTRMDEGAAFVDALAEAQASGFAEADPTRDLNGQDAADKIAILAWQAFDVAPATVDVQTRGLLPDPDALVREARDAGGVVRLIAVCDRTEAGVRASVAPRIVRPDSEFATLPAADNLVRVTTSTNGTVRLAGPGAGGEPTASAVLSDLLDAATR